MPTPGPDQSEYGKVCVSRKKTSLLTVTMTAGPQLAHSGGGQMLTIPREGNGLSLPARGNTTCWTKSSWQTN